MLSKLLYAHKILKKSLCLKENSCWFVNSRTFIAFKIIFGDFYVKLLKFENFHEIIKWYYMKSKIRISS